MLADYYSSSAVVVGVDETVGEGFTDGFVLGCVIYTVNAFESERDFEVLDEFGDDAAVAEASRAADASADVSASAPDAATAAATNTAVPVHSGESGKSGESGESASSSEQGYSAQGTPSQVAIPALRWDNLIIKDLALSDFSTMLKDKVSLEALEQGTKYKRALVCFPHKLVLRSGQSAAERHWEVYFGYDDGDFKDFCLERNQQRTKQNNARLKEVRTLRRLWLYLLNSRTDATTNKARL